MQNDLLSGLNQPQRQAVTADAGPVLVLAGPGSGKTRVLAFRIAYLIGSLGVRPYNILAVTFTNKAAREMESRVAKLLGTSAQGIFLGTFHGVCARLLRREADRLPFDSNFVIYDSDDQEGLVKRAVRELNLNEKLYRPASIHGAISRAKNELIPPAAYPIQSYRDEIISRVYKRYNELLLSANAVDFDDLLLWTVHLLENHPDVREKYARRFEHVLVDEFQDTNTPQYQLIRYLASHHRSVFVVGDEDQSIYRWRGADYRNVLRFEEDYAGCQKILLEQNYRSTQTVLDAARAVIDRNEHRTPKHLFSDRGQGTKIILYESGDDYAEASFVVDTIAQDIAAKTAKPSDFAVMYRTNAQSRLLEEAFLRAGLPYRLVGAQRFYGRREVKDVIAYLRLVHNPADIVSLARIINVPTRGIGDKTLETLTSHAYQAHKSAGEVLMDLRRGPDSPHWAAFTGRAGALLAEFGSQLAGWRELALTASLPTLFDQILSDVDYRQFIDDHSEEGQDRWANVEELRRIAFEYQDRGLVDFLENLALVSDQDTLPEALNAPTLLTLHAAKGLEFGQVFIVGMDDGILPHSRSFDEPEEMAEERRLLYVGLTRAKDKLYIVRADQRGMRGGSEETVPSRFLAELPAELIEGRRRKGAGRAGGRRSESYTSWEGSGGTTWSTTRAKPAPPPPVQQKYRHPMHVRHTVWGDGTVLESRIEDGEEVVDVSFKTVGFKRLIASLANLEIVS